MWASRLTTIYRGWWIVGTSYFAQMVTAGASGWVFGVLIRPMEDDLHWSRSQLVGVITVGSLIGGTFAARLGPVVDRHGPRTLMTVSAVLGGVALMALSLVHSPWQFYAIWAVFGLATPGFGLLGPRVAIANWFIRRRPLAFMIFTFGSATAGIVLAPTMAWVASAWGWRSAWVLMGLLAWALAPMSWLAVRRRPEDLGLLPDGDQPAEETPGTSGVLEPPTTSDEPVWTVREALHTRAFWMLTFGFMLASLPGSSIFVHMAPYVETRGLSFETAATVLSAYGAGALGGRAVWGFIILRLGIHRALVFFGVAYGSAIVAFLVPSAALGIYATALLLGLAIAGLQQMQAQVFPDYYGRAIVGTLTGYSGLTYTVARAVMTCPPRTGPSTELENLCRCGRRGRGMSKRKWYAAEEIIAKLREAEVHLAQGDTVGQAVRKLVVSEQTYYRWRREYGGMRVDQAKRLKELERENARLKQLVAEQALDNSILREVASGNF